VNGDETGYIPKSLDAMEKFLWWEMDQAIIGILLIGMGVAAHMMFTGMMLGLAGAWGYGKLKAGKHPRFAVHILYWWMPANTIVRTRAIPPSDQRYFLG
jgi:conjugal transfer pilus assembly protein TraL